MYDSLQLNNMLLIELLDIAAGLKLTNVKKLNKQTLIAKILEAQPQPVVEEAVEEKRKPRTRKPIGAKIPLAANVKEVVVNEPEPVKEEVVAPPPPPEVVQLEIPTETVAPTETISEDKEKRKPRTRKPLNAKPEQIIVVEAPAEKPKKQEEKKEDKKEEKKEEEEDFDYELELGEGIDPAQMSLAEMLLQATEHLSNQIEMPKLNLSPVDDEGAVDNDYDEDDEEQVDENNSTKEPSERTFKPTYTNKKRACI